MFIRSLMCIHSDRCRLHSGKQTGAIPPLKEPSGELCRKCGHGWIPSSLVLFAPPHAIGVIKGGLGGLCISLSLGL